MLRLNIHREMGAKKSKFTFIDLFAGIGGFHLALHRLGGKCVFVNEFNKCAKETYKNYFKKVDPTLFIDDERESLFWKDIKQITRTDTNEPKYIWKRNIGEIIPNFDILCAGFPCQPFSQVGKQKGFDDVRGTMFNDIERIVRARKPKVIFLENVRNIVSHNDNKTLVVILDKLDGAGYDVRPERGFNWEILRASAFGLPTHRPRFYLVAFRKDLRKANSFRFPSSTTPRGVTLRQIFGKRWPAIIGSTIRVGGRKSPFRKNPDGSWFRDRRNWDTYLVNNKPHVLTVEEAKTMMGFPSNFIFPGNLSYSQKMKQLGNSVAVSVIEAIAKNIIKTIHG